MTKMAALLVGVNKYGGGADLRGCVADTTAMYEWLARNRGLKTSMTQILTDGQATRANILRRLQWLAGQDAEVAVFCFSGHGTRVQDLDADEETGFDQAIVPVDYQRAGLILDDDLRRIYLTVPRQTKLIALLDSCYSARSDRGLFDSFKNYMKRRSPRVLPPELISDEAIKKTYASQLWQAPPAARNVLLLSGCRDFETSADAYFGNKAGYRGAFTYHLQRAIQILGPKADPLAIIEETRRTLAAGKFTQIPQLTGPPEWMRKPIFT